MPVSKSVTVDVDYDFYLRRTGVRAYVSCGLTNYIDQRYIEEEKEKVCESMLRQLLQQVSKDFVSAFSEAINQEKPHVSSTPEEWKAAETSEWKDIP